MSPQLRGTTIELAQKIAAETGPTDSGGHVARLFARELVAQYELAADLRATIDRVATHLRDYNTGQSSSQIALDRIEGAVLGLSEGSDG